MTERDKFIHEQVKGMLDATESIKHTAIVTEAPVPMFVMILFPAIATFVLGFFINIYIVVVLIAILFTLMLLVGVKPYFLAVTDRRIILIKTKRGFFQAQMANLGADTISLDNIEKIKRGGIGPSRSLTFYFKDKINLQRFLISPRNKGCSGQREFFEGWVNSINSKQLV